MHLDIAVIRRNITAYLVASYYDRRPVKIFTTIDMRTAFSSSSHPTSIMKSKPTPYFVLTSYDPWPACITVGSSICPKDL